MGENSSSQTGIEPQTFSGMRIPSREWERSPIWFQVETRNFLLFFYVVDIGRSVFDLLNLE